MDPASLKVTELKAELAERGLPTSGRKAELVERLSTALQESASSPPPAAVAATTAATATVKEEAQENQPVASTTSEEAVPKREAQESDTAAESETAGPATKRVKQEPNETSVKQEPTEASIAPKQTAKAEPTDGSVQGHQATGADDEDEEEEAFRRYEREAQLERSRNCPYLDTISRARLDFDFEKLCSVNLSNQNVYACLVCGKYYQGRGKGTNAYMHSLEASHHVFLNLHTLRFYCLPDNYEVIDNSLSDIQFVLKPTFSKAMMHALDHSSRYSRALDGTTYLPGIVGLNNIKANDYVNVVVQTLNRVPSLRNFFLDPEATRRMTDPLIVSSRFLLALALAKLIRKINNPRAFKSHVSPHEFLQAVNNGSKRQFRLTEQADPVDLLSWLLNTLQRKLSKRGSNIVADTFQGRMRVTSRKLPPPPDVQEVSGLRIDPNSEEYQDKVSEQKFLFLGLDLPPPPLYQDETRQNIIPQVPLFELLSKFDGSTSSEYKTYKDTIVKSFRLLDMPQYLILHVKRFTKNAFFVEKNPTIVNFPVKDIDFAGLVAEEFRDSSKTYKYDLLCNIVHDGLPGAGKGTYRAHLYHKGCKKWFEVQDLHVADVLPEMITLSESYIQVCVFN
ncbi:uncharacterized protein MONBRDRAFT_13756 [Monosiga brevicollis MX1]|uniref:Uncharacterized protein n=1 Tax=Monosiga brevicollis TaxID=81824 RepID=A9UP55_MONBE|nr:uncharacterized protein MONBRDRAFT_13756 [Monosiga brevicollis MX1]EDQ92814.1 predicted protein [Monosiga brevicollis MX1]|eukprot:XP_001742576.1 hypothetical protein [Monosiga brevicollis MX1]